MNFRAWDFENNRMIYTSDVQEWGNCLVVTLGGGLYDNANGRFDVDGDVSEQYRLMKGTGRKDCNNKDIYELDVVKDCYDTKYLVDWSDQEMCGFLLSPLNEPKVLVEEYKLWREGRLEVIGNNYEARQ